jgi:hypothetical protein
LISQPFKIPHLVCDFNDAALLAQKTSLLDVADSAEFEVFMCPLEIRQRISGTDLRLNPIDDLLFGPCHRIQ